MAYRPELFRMQEGKPRSPLEHRNLTVSLVCFARMDGDTVSDTWLDVCPGTPTLWGLDVVKFLCLKT